MRKIFINNDLSNVRTLSPFAYKDTIKTLDKSNEARVTLDGVQCFRSAVTSGRDVKGNGGMKYHLYFYMTEAGAAKRDTALREFLPLTAEEFRAYKQDPGYTIAITSATGLEQKPGLSAEQPLTREQLDDLEDPTNDELAVSQPATPPVGQRRKAKR
jgi:hypothetical protein